MRALLEGSERAGRPARLYRQHVVVADHAHAARSCRNRAISPVTSAITEGTDQFLNRTAMATGARMTMGAS